MEGNLQPAMSTDHPNIISIERELSWSPAGWEHIVVIVTDIPLDPSNQGHDAQKLHSVADHVGRTMKRNGHGFSRLVIRNQA
ncbi:hypothetical protein [Hwanghaeella sp.]|uniref:hypothetical protein n=1 Tax=Hwanghaeella sp. TaxID=2605943 RepID=UPI003CCB96F4